MMKFLRNWSAAIAAITALTFLPGCAATDDGRTTQAQGTGIGAAIGAGLGAAIGGIAGGGRGAAQGAAIGALAGGTAGFAYGTHVATQKAKYARAEDWLDACIASAQRANNRARSYNRNLSIQLSSLEKRGRAAMAARDKAAVTQIRTQIVQLQQQGAAEQKNLNGEINAQKNVLNDAQAKGSGRYGELRSNVGSLSETRAQLGQNLSRLAALENQIEI